MPEERIATKPQDLWNNYASAITPEMWNAQANLNHLFSGRIEMLQFAPMRKLTRWERLHLWAFRLWRRLR